MTLSRSIVAVLALSPLALACSAAPPDDAAVASHQALTLPGAACCSTSPELVTWDPTHAAQILTVDSLYVSGDALEQRGSTRTTVPRCSGKWYWEVTIDSFDGYGMSYPMLGVGDANAPLTGYYVGGTADSWSYFPSNAEKYNDSAAGNYGPYGTTAVIGDVVGVALDIDDHTLAFSKNGVSMGVAFTNIPSGEALYPMLGAADEYFAATARFAAPFAYAPPPGFSAYGGIAPTTWDPSHTGAIVSLSDGDFTASADTFEQRGSARATNAKTSGKWYWETRIESYGGFGASYPMIGVGDANAPLSGDYIGGTADGWSYFPSNAEKYNDSAAGNYGPYGVTAGIGDVVGVALDIDDHAISFYKNGVSMGVAFTNVPAGVPLYPMLGAADMYFQATTRFAAPFEFAAPAGYAPFDASAAGCR